MKFSLEPMSECHADAVIDIFNHYVTSSMAAYPDQPVGHEFFLRFRQMTHGYPALVATVEGGQVVGFGCLRPFHPASTLRRTAEVTYFILPPFTKHGIGTSLLQQLMEQAVPMGIENIVASISSRNEESVAFHLKNGFRECGRIERAGQKMGQDFDIIWMERTIPSGEPADFRAVRVTKTYTQHLVAPPSQVFPLLCPTREYEWIELWKCRMIYSDSGFAEDNCIITTEFPGDGGEEIWVVTRHEPEREIQFVRTNRLRVIRYTISLHDDGDGTTTATWSQVITALNENGNDWVRGITDEQFVGEMKALEQMLNHFLTTGKMSRSSEK